MRRGAIRTAQSQAAGAAQALDDIGKKAHPDPGLTCVFASGALDLDEAGRGIAERFQNGVVVGCSTAGEIHMGPYRDGTFTMLSIAAKECTVVTQRLDGMADLTTQRAFDLGSRAMADMARLGIPPNPATCFAVTLIDSKHGNEDILLTGLRSALGEIPLFGGGAGGEGTRNDQAAVYHDGRFRKDCSVLILVSLNRHFKVFSAHHYAAVGKELVVTKTDPQQRIVQELNHRNAGREYADALGVDFAELQRPNAWLPPLMLRVGSNQFARSASHLDETGHLHMACPVSAGVVLRLGESVGLLSNLSDLENDIRSEVGDVELTFGVECIMRRIETEKLGQTDVVADWFRRNKVVGFCSFGEQFKSMHLNHTFTGIAIGKHRTSPRLRAMLSRRDTEIAELEAENKRLRQLVNTLKSEPDSVAVIGEDTFNLFKSAVILEEMVQRRTEELAVANKKLQTELARRRRSEAALRQARQEAINANESKNQFVAGVSHDMQQPLNAVRLLLGRLEHEQLSSRGAQAVLQMEGSLHTLETMLTDFFDISKMDAGGYVVAPGAFALGPILHAVGQEYAPQASSRRLSLKVMDTSVVVRTDAVMLKRVLRNLVSNALRYTPSGRVLVGVRRLPGHVGLYVVDTGVGLPANAVQEVFRPYYQLNHPDILVRRGSGFGLALVDRICRLLGLTITVRSQVGKGSGFCVRIPLGRAEDLPQQSETAAPPMPTPLSGAKVLVIEDDGASQEGLLALLDAWGCETLAASDGDEALHAVLHGAFRPDLVLTDHHLGMARDNGLTAATRLTEALSISAPVVVVSSDHAPELKRSVADAGAVFVAKPIKPARLRAALSSALQAAAKGARDSLVSG